MKMKRAAFLSAAVFFAILGCRQAEKRTPILEEQPLLMPTPPPVITMDVPDGDWDGDGDFDLDDFQEFALCMLGPAVPVEPACLVFDMDVDGDVDMADFVPLQGAFGPAVVFELTNPAPLLINYPETIPPYSTLTLQVNYRIDIGAYEYWPPFTPVEAGDFSLNHRVTMYDLYWFNLCEGGPGQPIRDHLTVSATGDQVPCACWLCDLDEDGDVDNDDRNLFLPLISETFVWGDANRDGVVDAQDVAFVTDCIANDPYYISGSPCETADLNESLSINNNDLELVQQALSP